MKRLLFGFGAGVIIAIASMIGVFIQPVAAQDANNFTIHSFDVDYYLNTDEEGRSTLKTVERITAQFPLYDQNHGLERALPEKYDGHSTSLKIESITDGAGKELSYSDRSSDDNITLRIGDADTYVHGMQTYVITYTQRDVTRFFADTNDDEFYWDVNGTQWLQAMAAVRARIHIPASLAQKLTGKASCYVGAEGGTSACPITSQSLATETIFSVQVANINPQQTVTFAIGFTPNTFTGYQQTWQERLWATVLTIWLVLQIVGSVVAVAVVIWMSLRYKKVMNRVKGRGIIVPEYLPPKDSVLVSAQVLKNATSDITAQVIDLAVRHYLKIYQVSEKTTFKAAEYELEIIKDIADLQKEERRLLKNIFAGAGTEVGSRFAMSKLRNHSLGTKLTAGRKAVQKSTRREYGLYERAETDAKRFKLIGVVLLIVGIVTVSPLILIAAIVAFVFMELAWPLTGKGIELRDYLKGLREYISVAEKDRIAMLQSPEGAEKVGVKVGEGDPVQLVKLYERVLPYAVLFGIEKQWTKQLGTYYETSSQQPDWYVGNSPFNAVVFSSALGNFASQSSSYSSAVSASTGGSDGGGSSGGGGGGGGGGGW
jgi:hypothetical protein